MQWLDTFKKQNQLSIAVAAFLFLVGTGLTIYSSSGTKYDVIEYCFKPEKINNPKNKYCTDELKFIAPIGFFNQEKYTPANPRFQRGVYLLGDKLTRLREIPATNPLAPNYTLIGLLCAITATLLLAQRSKRYKYEFAAFYAELEKDLHYQITDLNQAKELRSHAAEIETNYIKDRIQLQDEIQRYKDMPEGQRQAKEEEQAKYSEVSELQHQADVAKLKLAIAELQAKESAALRTIKSDPVEIVKAEEIDYEALCPGKAGGIEYYDWRDLIDDAVGIILAGNSGSGKTSVACWVAGWLTKDNPAQVLALDPHGKINTIWEEMGIYCIYDFRKIEKQLEILIALLDERRMMDKSILDQQPQIIVFADEINACLKNFENKESMTVAIERLGSEARKYGIALIALNQSSNVEDLGISAPMRSNYLLILLNASARQYARNNWKKDDPRAKAVEETAYSCVVAGSVAPAVAIHPTHHTYKQFKKKGNKPKGLLPINQSILTISLADDIVEEEDWYQAFIDMQTELGRVPSPKEIKVKWEELMEEECSSKQAEMIHEYLKELN